MDLCLNHRDPIPPPDNSPLVLIEWPNGLQSVYLRVFVLLGGNGHPSTKRICYLSGRERELERGLRPADLITKAL